jgi:hypothetical protein
VDKTMSNNIIILKLKLEALKRRIEELEHPEPWSMTDGKDD